MAEAEAPAQTKTLLNFLNLYLVERSGCIQGFEWIDSKKELWKLPWKIHKTTNWGEPDAMVLHAWAKHKYNYSGGEPPRKELRKWKEKLRNAIGTNPLLKEREDLHNQNTSIPYKVYQFCNAKDKLSQCAGEGSFPQKSSGNCLSKQIQPLESSEPCSQNYNLPCLDVLTKQTSIEMLINNTCLPTNESGNDESSQDISEIFDEILSHRNLSLLAETNGQSTHGSLAGFEPIQEESSQTFKDIHSEIEHYDKMTKSPNEDQFSDGMGDLELPQEIYMYQDLIDHNFDETEALIKSFENFRSRSPITRVNEISHISPETHEKYLGGLDTDLRNTQPSGSHQDITEEKANSAAVELSHISPPSNCLPSNYMVPKMESSVQPVMANSGWTSSNQFLSSIPQGSVYQDSANTLSLSLYYCSSLVKSHETQDKFKLCFVEDDSMRDMITHCPSEAQFGPSNAQLIDLPHPQANMNICREDNVWRILRNMVRGITVSCSGGDIYATRYCKAVTHFTSWGGKKFEMKREKKCKIFDFQESFMSVFHSENWASLEASVKIRFGVRVDARQDAVSIVIVHKTAERMLEERKKHEMQLSLEPECSLSNDFDTRLAIEKDLRKK